MLRLGIQFRDGAVGANTEPNLDPASHLEQDSHTEVLDPWVFRNGRSEVDFRWSRCGGKKHCYASAPAEFDFKAADADKAGAMARLPPPASPRRHCSSSQPPSEADTERKIKYLRLIMMLFINM